MKISEETLNRLDFFKVLERIAREASFDESRKAVLDIRPRRIERSFWESVAEFRSLLKFDFDRKISSLRDVSGFLRKIESGELPPEKEFYDFALYLGGLEEIHSYIENTLFLRNHFHFKVFPELKDKILSVVSEDGVREDASDLLRELFPKKEELSRRAREVCYRELDRKPSIFRGRFFKLLNGRYVLPLISGALGSQVHSSYISRGRISGHSEGGSTVYFEPQALVSINEELEKVNRKINLEIARILGELAIEVSENLDQHRKNWRNVIRLDVIRAISLWASRVKAEYPRFKNEPVLHIKNARNPLIENPVPITLSLTAEKPVMLITGPNTGGKTVTLKTIGLFVALLYSGIPFPSSPESILGTFSSLHADIGDEQSVEQSLSTFASHLKVLIELYGENPDSSTLFLWDEIGAGTDPHEGASLGVAVLKDLLKRGVRVVATTHHEYIKNFAITEEKIETAAMEFDMETLSPTYRLLVGVPGSSHALEIARKMGVPEHIIREAYSMMGEEKKFVERTTRKIAQELSRQKKVSEELERQKILLRDRIDALFAEASEELKKVISSVEKGEMGVKKARELIAKIESRVEAKVEEIAPVYERLSPEQIKESMEVLVIPLGKKGKVLSRKKNRVEVMIGGMVITCSFDDLAEP